MTTNPDLLIIVARAPIPGTAKTRLAATVGAEAACALYRSFLADLAYRFDGSGPFDQAWGFHPPETDFRTTLATITGSPINPAVHVVPQSGDTFNERLTNLFRWGFDRGHERVAIMASDSPHLPKSIVTDAFASLAQHDVTLGRVADGGYYLIGLAAFSDLLIDLPMSTADAGDAVADRASELRMSFGEIAPSFDVDEERDLDLLAAALAPDGAIAPRTWRTLQELRLPRSLPISADHYSYAC